MTDPYKLKNEIEAYLEEGWEIPPEAMRLLSKAAAALIPADDTMQHYSRALDEIYRLRRALAYEAGVTLAHLGLKSFPKSRVQVVHEQVRRMRTAAAGHCRDAYSTINGWALASAMREAGADNSLTRRDWEAQG